MLLAVLVCAACASAASPPPVVSPDAAVTVFTTALAFTGNFGNRAAITAQCVAAAPGWCGAVAALVSYTNDFARDQLPELGYMVASTQGVPIADNLTAFMPKYWLTAKPLRTSLYAADVTTAQYIWTGSWWDGTLFYRNCHDWSDDSSANTGRAGRPNRNYQARWFSAPDPPCNNPAPVLCACLPTTAAPSRAPTTTLAPSRAPLRAPSRAPSRSPSVAATNTVAPSPGPTGSPTSAPSAVPTGSPLTPSTGAPSDSPTITMTHSPIPPTTYAPTEYEPLVQSILFAAPVQGLPSDITCLDTPVAAALQCTGTRAYLDRPGAPASEFEFQGPIVSLLGSVLGDTVQDVFNFTYGVSAQAALTSFSTVQTVVIIGAPGANCDNWTDTSDALAYDVYAYDGYWVDSTEGFRRNGSNTLPTCSNIAGTDGDNLGYDGGAFSVACLCRGQLSTAPFYVTLRVAEAYGGATECFAEYSVDASTQAMLEMYRGPLYREDGTPVAASFAQLFAGQAANAVATSGDPIPWNATQCPGEVEAIDPSDASFLVGVANCSTTYAPRVQACFRLVTGSPASIPSTGQPSQYPTTTGQPSQYPTTTGQPTPYPIEPFFGSPTAYPSAQPSRAPVVWPPTPPGFQAVVFAVQLTDLPSDATCTGSALAAALQCQNTRAYLDYTGAPASEFYFPGPIVNLVGIEMGATVQDVLNIERVEYEGQLQATLLAFSFEQANIIVGAPEANCNNWTDSTGEAANAYLADGYFYNHAYGTVTYEPVPCSDLISRDAYDLGQYGALAIACVCDGLPSAADYSITLQYIPSQSVDIGPCLASFAVDASTESWLEGVPGPLTRIDGTPIATSFAELFLGEATGSVADSGDLFPWDASLCPGTVPAIDVASPAFITGTSDCSLQYQEFVRACITIRVPTASPTGYPTTFPTAFPTHE